MNLKTTSIALATLAFLQTAPIVVPPAAAQSAGDIETVTVTARKRSERLIDVPVAATAFSGDELRRYATADMSSLSSQVPGVRFDFIPAGSGSALTIRGVGAAWFETSIDSSVVADIDGVPVSRGRILQEALLDLSSVDVLKGPQALYFGKNSPAGVVSLSSANPKNYWEGYITAGYEAQDQEIYGEAAGGGPVTDDLAVRFAVRGSDMFSGWIHNVAKAIDDPFHPGQVLPGAGAPSSPQTKTTAGRFTAVYTPAPRFDATLKVFATHYHDNGNDQTEEISHCAAGATQPSVFGVTDPFGDCRLDGVTSNGAETPERATHYPLNYSGLGYSQFDSALTSLTMNYHLPNITLTSVTGYYYYLEYENDNYDMTVYDQLGGADQEHYQSFTQEFRAVTDFDFPVNFTAGFFFQHENRNVHTSGAIFDLVPFGVTADPRNGQTNNYMAHATDHGQTYSPFLEASWKILDNLEVAAGVRYTHEDKAGSTGYTFVNQTFGCPTCAFPLSPEGVRLLGRLGENNLSPEATITWHPETNIMVYAAYKTGYKSGGFSNPSIIPYGTAGSSLIFKHERAEGFEFGAKASLLNDTLTGDVTLFNYAFSNLQVTAFNAPTTSFTIQNAASARSQGLEVNANYRATDELSLRASGAFIDAHYARFPAAQCYAGQTALQGCDVAANSQDLAGRPLARDPNIVASLGFSYDHAIIDTLMIGLTGDIRFSGGYYMDATDPIYAYQKGFNTVDASLRLYRDGSPWEVAIIGRNLTNKIYGIAGSSTPGGPPGQYGAVVPRLRQVSIQMTYQF